MNLLGLLFLGFSLHYHKVTEKVINLSLKATKAIYFPPKFYGIHIKLISIIL